MYRIIVIRYNEEMHQIAKNLSSLDKQTEKLTEGDLNIIKQRNGKVKFNVNHDPEDFAINVRKKDSQNKIIG